MKFILFCYQILYIDLIYIYSKNVRHLVFRGIKDISVLCFGIGTPLNISVISHETVCTDLLNSIEFLTLMVSRDFYTKTIELTLL